MNFLKKIKQFWVRKILRKVYNPEEVLDIPFNKMNFAEIKLLIEHLYFETIDIREEAKVMKGYVSEIPAQCDKCSNFDEPGNYCFKCEGTGVIKNKYLFDWPEED